MKKLRGSEKFIIMCDIEKRAKELTSELRQKGGLVEGQSIDGYRYVGKDWKEAKEAGFEKQANKQWIGFTNSGDGTYSDRAFEQALKEYKEKLPQTFLENVYHYEYLV